MTVSKGALQEKEVGLGGGSEGKEQWGSELSSTLLGAAHPGLYTGTRVHTVERLLRGKEGAAQRPLSTLTRESLVEKVRTAVTWY